jgi:hypothetical protein
MRTCLLMGTLVAGTLVVVAAPPARAQPAAVETLIRQGVEQRKRGKDQIALPLFQKAYDLERSPRTAAQLGLGEASLGYWLAAEQHLMEALTATRNPWVARNEAELRRTLLQVRMSIGELAITGSPAGAEVTVNGQPAGVLPLGRPVRLPEGAAQVTMRAPGHREASMHTKIEGGKRAAVNLELERTAPAASLPAAAPAVTAARALPPAATHGAPSGVDARDPGVAARQPEPAPSPAWVRPASWVAASAAVVAAGVGGYGLYTQRARGQDFDNYKVPGTNQRACGTSRPDRGGPRCAELYGQQQSAKRLVVPGFAAAGVLAAAAIVGLVSSAEGGGGRQAAGWMGVLTADAGRGGGARSLTAAWARSF